MNYDRIKLALAMGFSKECNIDAIPDPFTDANDDYAVLEWMRNACPGGCFDDGYGDERPRWVAYLSHIMEEEGREDALDFGVYQIGDYARAALMVIDNE